MIYVGKRYTATLSGRKLKAATCVNCGCVYCYAQSHTVQGVGVSPYYLDNEGAERRASEYAQRKLQQAFETDAPAACPACGWIQPAMLKAMRGTRNFWTVFLGLVALLVGALAVVVFQHEPLNRASLYLAASAVLLGSLCYYLRASFNPNGRAYERVGKEGGPLPQTIPLESITGANPEPQVLANVTEALNEHKSKAEKRPGDWVRNSEVMDEEKQRADAGRRTSGMLRRLIPLVAVGLVLLVCAEPVGAAVEEEKLYNQLGLTRTTIMKYVDGNSYWGWGDAENYLYKYPNGKHAADVRAWLDEYNAKKKELKGKGSGMMMR